MKKNLILFLLIVGFLLFSWWIIYWGIYLPKSTTLEERIINIEKGQGSKEIASNLKNEGLIGSEILFRLYVLTTGQAGKLQAGTYLFTTLMNVPQIVEKLVRGEVLKEKITIIEGWNLRDIAWHFEGRGMFQAEELFESVGFPLIDYRKTSDLPQPKDFSQDFDFLKDKPKYIGLEGYLFPDTYEINKGDNIEEIVKKMLNNFGRKLTSKLREEIKNQGKSIFEIINMASLIEKEVQTSEDKKLVSGILWKRLKNNIPLQVDAAISYITGKKTTKISFEETKIDSPYNTYKYKGLPLGPICNPGLESIEAALYPKNSDYWYYLSTQDGETIFSKTFKEHNLAKEKYLK